MRVCERRIYLATSEGLSLSRNLELPWRTTTQADGLGSNTVRDVYMNEGNLYVATSCGLSVHEKGPLPTIRRLTFLTSLPRWMHAR